MPEFRIIVDRKGKVNRLRNPEVWKAYQKRVVWSVTEEAKTFISRTAESSFKNPTGGVANAWSTSFNDVTMQGNIRNSKPYAYYLNAGIKRQQMTWLLNTPVREYEVWRHRRRFVPYGTSGATVHKYTAQAPIPLKVGGGTIFRRATAKSMQEGKWMHPGIAPMEFVERGLEAFKRERLPELFKDITVELLVTPDIPERPIT